MSEEFYYVLPLWIIFILLLIFGWIPERGNIYGTKRSDDPKGYWSGMLFVFIFFSVITYLKFFGYNGCFIPFINNNIC